MIRSFFTTGDVEVEILPMLYDVRNSKLRTSVRVKAGVPGYYERNTISLYYSTGNVTTLIESVISTDTAAPWGRVAPALLGQAPASTTLDTKFVFDLEESGAEKFHQVVFEKADNLQIMFAISAYISILNPG